jgi:hypothetical protein
MQICGGVVLLLGLWQLLMGITSIYRRKVYSVPPIGDFSLPSVIDTGWRAIIVGIHELLMGLILIASAVILFRGDIPLNFFGLYFCGLIIGLLINFMLHITKPKTKNEQPTTYNL